MSGPVFFKYINFLLSKNFNRSSRKIKLNIPIKKAKKNLVALHKAIILKEKEDQLPSKKGRLILQLSFREIKMGMKINIGTTKHLIINREKKNLVTLSRKENL